jgi:hypothetical protein
MSYPQEKLTNHKKIIYTYKTITAGVERDLLPYN